MATRVSDHLRDTGRSARTVSTKLRYTDFSIRSRSTSLRVGIDDAGQIGDLAGLTSSLGKLGISPDTAASFIPAVTDFVGKAGGSELGGKLAAALKQPPSS